MSTYDNASLTYDAGTTSYDGAPGAIAGLPQATIEIAFDDGPYVWEPYWTDVTEYVRSVNVRRGRNDDLSPFVGTASVELDNRDRRFDPFNTSGTYYGKLLPRRQIRIRAAAGANTYDVFRGYVAGWPTSYTEAGFDATVSLDCFDALAFLASEDTPDTWLSDYIKSLNPSRYYQLTDPVVTQTSSGTDLLSAPIKDYGSSGLNLTSFANQVQADSSIIPASPSSINVGRGQISGSTTGIPSVSAITLSGFMRYSNVYSSNLNISDGYRAIITFVHPGGLGTPGFEFLVDIGSGATDRKRFSFATNISDSDVFHLALTYDATNGLKCYVNGGDVTGAITSTTGFAIVQSSTTINYARAAHVFSCRTTLTAAQIRQVYEYGQQNLSEQIPSRLTRIFRTTPFPEITSPSTDFLVWEAPLATQFIQGLNNDNPINNELANLSASEGGELFCARDGVIYLTGRDTQNYSSPFLPYEPCIVQATFSDAAGTALPYGPTLDVEWDADGIINDLSLTFTGGGNVTASDSTSISANGKRSQTISTQLTGPTGAGSPQDLADLRVEYFRHVIPRVSPLDVGMTRDLTDWQTLLSLELMDAFAVQRTPSVGSALDFRLQVQAIDHQIVPGDWRMRVTGSARYSNWFTADVDDADGARLAV
jgi:hypothetical protein